MKNNTLSPHLKSTFSSAVVVLPSGHKPDAGVAEEEDYTPHYMGRGWDHLTSILGGNVMEKQMDTGYALVQCCLYRSRNVPTALTAWLGLALCCWWHTSISILGRGNSPEPAVLWVAQIICYFYCNNKTTRLSSPKHSACYSEERSIKSSTQLPKPNAS